MRFAESLFLYLLWGVAILGLLLFLAAKRKQKIMQRFAGGLVKEIAPNISQKRNAWKNILVICVFTFSVLALARPQWGFKWQQVKRQGLDIIVAIDTSKSMLTQDVKPNRLERTKFAVKDLLKKLKSDRIGLIAFAGTSFLVCPLTVDYNGFLLSLEDLGPQSIPRGGTAIATAIRESIEGYDNTPSKYKAIIIITDGENLEGDPLKVAKEAKEKGIRIFCIGIGAKEGEMIQVKNEKGDYEFLKDDQGNFVKSRLNEKLLQQIALTTGGLYVRSSGAEFGLDVIYDQELSRMEKREIESEMEKRYHERFQIPLVIALLALIGETIIGSRKKIKS